MSELTDMGGNRMSAADRLDQIAARANAATKGPWSYGGRNRIQTPVIDVDEADWGGEGLSGYAIHAQQDTGAWRYADAEFMAHARADVPALVAALRAVLEEIDKRGKLVTEVLPPSLAARAVSSYQFNVYASDIIRAIEEALS